MRPVRTQLGTVSSRVRKVDRGLGLSALLVGAVALVLGLVVAPPDAVQGQAQRLMYVHVPAAWTGFLAVGVLAAASLALLVGRGRRSVALAQAAAELGTVMLGLTIVEGSVWGQSAWGVWWTWDPRLVTTAVLFLSCAGYLAFRALSGSTRAGLGRTAIAGLLVCLEVPVVHFSVLWWRSIHQPPTILRPSLSPPIATPMLVALLVSVLAFTLAGAWWVHRRYLSLAPQVDLEAQRLRVAADQSISLPSSRPLTAEHLDRQP